MSPLGTLATSGITVPAPDDEDDDDDDECGAVGGMRTGRGHHVPQITHSLTRDGTRPPRWEAGD
jgi:hypothetical protein